MKKLSAVCSVLVILVMLGGMVFHTTPARAATWPEIEASIVAGLNYLASTQQANGSWSDGDSYAGNTCAVLTKFQDRAKELGFASAFDPAYPYSANVDLGYDYVFSRAFTNALTVQTAGDPDFNGDGIGVFFNTVDPGTSTSHAVYETALCMMALGSSNTPNRVNDLGIDFNGDTNPDTFLEISQNAAELLAWAQNETGNYRGGWRYGFNTADSDESVSGFAVLGLAYAEEFGATIPAFVKPELEFWVTFIQCPDGGGGYVACPGSNSYRTGHLITQMAFLGDTPATPRMNNALTYIETNWTLPPTESYLSAWSLMKGLVYSGVTYLNLDGGALRDDDWFREDPSRGYDMASYIISAQQVDGSWPSSFYEGSSDALATAFALLVLEKAAPPPPNTAPVAFDDSYATKMSVAFTGATVLGNDTDAESDPLTAVLQTGPANASDFTFNADGTFDYEPANGFRGVDTFTYVANDGTVDSNVATVSITVTPLVATFMSIQEYDGWILEASQGSNTGGNAYAGQILRFGDSAANQAYRSILSFDASSLPADAVLVGSWVRMRQFDTKGTDPLTTHGRLIADVRKGAFGGNTALVPSDWQAAATKVSVGRFLVETDPKWYRMTLAAANLQYINPGGVTQFRVRFTIGTDADGIEDWIRFASGWNAASTRPRLVIEYYIPHP